jgi:hypothetical protein
MTDTESLNLAILTATCAMGWGVIAYDGYARLKGLPTGAMFASEISQIQAFAWIAIIISLVVAPIVGSWWHLFVVLIGGNILTRILFAALGAYVQPLVAIGTFVMLVVTGWRFWPQGG